MNLKQITFRVSDPGQRDDVVERFRRDIAAGGWPGVVQPVGTDEVLVEGSEEMFQAILEKVPN